MKLTKKERIVQAIVFLALDLFCIMLTVAGLFITGFIMGAGIMCWINWG